MLNKVLNKIRRIIYDRWGSKKGHGCRVTPEEWDNQYLGGQWNKLKSENEKEHYEIIVDLCRKHEGNCILDLGCGDGALYGYIEKYLNKKYLYKGVDLSIEAIKLAKNQYVNVEFEEQDLEIYQPSGKVDIVVFNESLYYIKRPLVLLARLESYLNEKGCFIVSMCEYKGHDEIWRLLDTNYKCLSLDNMINSDGQSWRVSKYVVLST